MFAVTFFRRFAYSAFDANSPHMHGGAEVRAKRFAEGLADTGEFDVTFLVGNEGQPQQRRFGNINVVREPFLGRLLFKLAYTGFRKSGSRTASFPWIRLHSFRLGLLWQLPVLFFEQLIWSRLPLAWRRPKPRPLPYFGKLKSDAVCCFGANAGAADIVASGRKYNVPVVLFLMNDWEADPARLAAREYIPELFEYTSRLRYAVENASEIVVQNERQAALVEECCGRTPVLIRNPVNLALESPAPPQANRRHVFWVGRAEAESQGHKRPHLLLELARRLPQIPFVAVMNAVDTRAYDSLCAAAPANLTIIERLSREQIDPYYENAALYLSTSGSEGFPNTFLEAAKYSTPIVSLEVDPDGMLSQHRAGVCCQGNLELMGETLLRLWEQPTEREHLGAAARRYVEERHGLAGRVEELAALLRKCGRHEPAIIGRQ